MKKIAIAAATKMEIEPLFRFLESNATKISSTEYRLNEHEISILMTGVGILHTTYSLMNYLMDHRPDFWIQAGIGGAFDHSLEIGNVYAIESEILVDVGAQDKDGRIIDPFELGWLKTNEDPYRDKILTCSFIPEDLGITKASGMTTLHSHGLVSAIQQLLNTKHAQVENMEGAAFFYISLMKNIPFISLRSISNKVEERNKESWKISLAIKNLSEFLIGFLQAKKSIGPF